MIWPLDPCSPTQVFSLLIQCSAAYFAMTVRPALDLMTVHPSMIRFWTLTDRSLTNRSRYCSFHNKSSLLIKPSKKWHVLQSFARSSGSTFRHISCSISGLSVVSMGAIRLSSALIWYRSASFWSHVDVPRRRLAVQSGSLRSFEFKGDRFNGWYRKGSTNGYSITLGMSR